ncbi:MAG: RHS repeat protein [Gammaproteobacteria bacterium]|nr:MAG: RHS repeat protein [Gammaproteobacteria bacterium]
MAANKITANIVEFSDSNNNQYQLSTSKPSIAGTTQVNLLPKDITLIRPLNWNEAWKIIFPAKPCPAGPEKIAGAINEAIAARRIHLIGMPSKSVSKTSKGKGGAGAKPKAAEPEAVPSSSFAPSSTVSPETKSSCNDSTAISTAQPASVAEGAAGAASVANTCTRGCPISMISGEELLSLTDFVLPGPLLFVWKRTYRSGHDRNLGLGHGWTYAGCERLSESSSSVELSDDEGRVLTFKRPQLNQRSKLVNEQMALDFVAYETYVLRQHNQPHKIFSRLGQTGSFRLTQIQHPSYKPGIAGGEAKGFALTLHYNAQDRLSQIAGNWGKSLLFAYDNQGQISSVTLLNQETNERRAVAEYSYSPERDLIAQRDSAGRGETYEYNNHLFVKRTLTTGFSYYYEWETMQPGARCLHTWGDKGIYDYRFEWDVKNNRTLATDSRGFKTEFVYNEFGLITQETDNEGGVHFYTYENGLRTSYTDPEGNVTWYAYDSASRPTGIVDALAQRQAHYYFQDKLVSSTDKDGAHWQRKYNKQGLLETLEAPDGKQTHYAYNSQGLLTRETDFAGRARRYEWNDSGELTALINSEGHKQVFKYNPWGQLVQMDVWLASHQHGGTTYYFYTSSGELERITYPGGEKVDIVYNANGQIERLSDRRGRVTHYEYDGLSQVIRRTDPEGNSIAYEYDTERNLTRLINENNDEYQFFYDGNERLIKEIGFDGRIQHYKYNKAGHLIKHLDAGEIVTEFERDALGQMLAKTSSSLKNPSAVAELNRYLYDPVGRIKEAYNSAQYITFQYDRMGYLIKEHHSDLNEQRQRLSDTMVDIHYELATSGQLKRLHLPGNQIIDYGYDSFDRLQSVSLNETAITKIQRNEFGFELNRQQGDLITHSEYDPMGRLVKQHAHIRQQKAGVIDRQYQYDPFGNLSKFKDGNWEVNYVYDMIDRLKRTEGSLKEKFVFDPAGNLLGQEKNDAGKATQGNRLTLQGDRKFEYDARGNLVRETRGKGGKLKTVYEYNFNNHLIKVVKDNQSTEYCYDPLGRRTQKHDSFGITKYLWAGDQLAQEQRNQIKKTYVYEPESFKPIAMVQDGEIYHYHLDHLGTPRELTNEQGKVVWKAQYKTYGNVALKDVEEVENNLRFQGQYFDEETGLHYNRHRYYDPSIGQFTTQDPIGLLGGINNYQYAPNPTGWVDPFGLCKEELRVNKARQRQYEMLKQDVGYNVSPIGWDAYPSIGREGSFISDKQSVTDILGNIDSVSILTIDKSKVIQLENAFGLEPGSLQDGFKIRQVNNIGLRAPRSPMEGNRFFLGAGNHLPGGAPEMVVNSIPTVDGNGVFTLVEVKVV